MNHQAQTMANNKYKQSNINDFFKNDAFPSKVVNENSNKESAINDKVDMSTDIIYMASFDIGKKNFAFYIEEVRVSSLHRLKPPKQEYNVDGTCTDSMENILCDVYRNGKTILHINLDLTIGTDLSQYIDKKLYYNMTNVLDNYQEYWNKCSYIIIEKQMSFGRRKQNTMALKLGQHCFSYFVIKHNNINVIEFPAYHKTQILGAPKKKGRLYKNGNYKWNSMKKPQRKKWSVVKACEILKFRNENEILNNIKKADKRDDLADTLTQLQAFKYLKFIKKVDNL